MRPVHKNQRMRTGICYIQTGKGTTVRLNKRHSARNPTFDEVMEFLRSDDTSSINMGENACALYTASVFNNAMKRGIRCGFCAVYFKDTAYGHAVNVWNTSDRGYIFTESQPRDYGDETDIPETDDMVIDLSHDRPIVKCIDGVQVTTAISDLKIDNIVIYW